MQGYKQESVFCLKQLVPMSFIGVNRYSNSFMSQPESFQKCNFRTIEWFEKSCMTLACTFSLVNVHRNGQTGNVSKSIRMVCRLKLHVITFSCCRNEHLILIMVKVVSIVVTLHMESFKEKLQLPDIIILRLSEEWKISFSTYSWMTVGISQLVFLDSAFNFSIIVKFLHCTHSLAPLLFLAQKP